MNTPALQAAEAEAPVVQEADRNHEGKRKWEREEQKREDGAPLHHLVSFHHVPEEVDVPCQWLDAVEPWLLAPKTRDNWIVFLLWWGAIIAVAVCFSVFAFPRIVDKAFDPATEAVQDALTEWQIGIICALAICLLPVTIILTKEPFVWLAAVVFSFPKALAIAIAGTTVGMAIPYLLTRKWLRKWLLRFLRRYRYTKAVLLGVRKAGPLKTVLIMRLGPVPYPLVNYLMAVPEDIQFWQYMLASIPGKLPSNCLGVLFGRNLKGLASLLQGEKLPAGQIAYNLVSLAAAIIIVVAGFLYARKALRQLEAEAKLEEEAAAALAGNAAGDGAGSSDAGGVLVGPESHNLGPDTASGEIVADGTPHSHVSGADGGSAAATERLGLQQHKPVDTRADVQASAITHTADLQAGAVADGSSQRSSGGGSQPQGRVNRPSWWPCCQVWPDSVAVPAPAMRSTGSPGLAAPAPAAVSHQGSAAGRHSSFQVHSIVPQHSHRKGDEHAGPAQRTSGTPTQAYAVEHAYDKEPAAGGDQNGGGSGYDTPMAHVQVVQALAHPPAAWMPDSSSCQVGDDSVHAGQGGGSSSIHVAGSVVQPEGAMVVCTARPVHAMMDEDVVIRTQLPIEVAA